MGYNECECDQCECDSLWSIHKKLAIKNVIRIKNATEN